MMEPFTWNAFGNFVLNTHSMLEITLKMYFIGVLFTFFKKFSCITEISPILQLKKYLIF